MADAKGSHHLYPNSGWEVTCDVLLMRIPGSQEKWEECSAVLSTKPNVWTFGLVVECLTDVGEVVGSRLGGVTS